MTHPYETIKLKDITFYNKIGGSTMSKIYLTRQIELEYGRKQFIELLKEFKRKGTTNKEIKYTLKSMFPKLDFSKSQPNSWYIKYGLNTGVRTFSGNHVLDRVIDNSEVPLKSQLEFLYIEEQQSSLEISEYFSSEYNELITKDVVLRWLDLCELPKRNSRLSSKLRWEKPQQQENARRKTLEFFQTPEGELQREVLREWYRAEYLPRFGGSNFCSSIETTVKDYLLELGCGFEHQRRIQVKGLSKNGIVPDFIVGFKIIEVYGDYWHNRPGQVSKDSNRLYCLNSEGYEVLILWESEIRQDFESVKVKINDFIK